MERGRAGEVLQARCKRLCGACVGKEAIEAAVEGERLEVDAAFHEVVRGDLSGVAGDAVSADPATAENGGGVDQKRQRARQWRDHLIVGNGCGADWVTNRSLRRLRARVGVAVPLVEAVASKTATICEINGQKDVALSPVTRKGAGAGAAHGHSRLQEFEIHVAVTVVDEPLGCEEKLVVAVRANPADRINVAEVVLGGNAPRRRGEGIDVGAVLEAAAKDGGVARPTRSGVR